MKQASLTLLTLLKKRSSVHYLLLGLVILGFLGFLDATYLTILHYKNVAPPCSLALGCETVLTSTYAVFLGFPIALAGAFYYVVVMSLAGILWQNQTSTHPFFKQTPSLLLFLTTLGLAVGIYLVYLQAFVIHAFCQYCLLSELIDFLLFDISWWLWRSSEKLL